MHSPNVGIASLWIEIKYTNKRALRVINSNHQRYSNKYKSLLGVIIFTKTLMETKPKRSQTNEWNCNMLVPKGLMPAIGFIASTNFRFKIISRNYKAYDPKNILKNFYHTSEYITNICHKKGGWIHGCSHNWWYCFPQWFACFQGKDQFEHSIYYEHQWICTCREHCWYIICTSLIWF